MANEFEDIPKINTLTLSDEQRTAVSQVAKDFDAALQQGYVEANVLKQALDIVKQLMEKLPIL